MTFRALQGSRQTRAISRRPRSLDTEVPTEGIVMATSKRRKQQVKKASKTSQKPKRKRLPTLANLHKRHRGLTPAVCASYAEAASVCLSRHHHPPRSLSLRAPNGDSAREVEWPPPSKRTQDAWANRDDATRDGAYGVSLAVVETELGWVAVSRAETRTGADYYVGPRGTRDLEGVRRLEVSGVDDGDEAIVSRRVAEKVRQAQDGKSSLPAIASVVGFKAAVVVIREAVVVIREAPDAS